MTGKPESAFIAKQEPRMRCVTDNLLHNILNIDIRNAILTVKPAIMTYIKIILSYHWALMAIFPPKYTNAH